MADSKVRRLRSTALSVVAYRNGRGRLAARFLRAGGDGSMSVLFRFRDKDLASRSGVPLVRGVCAQPHGKGRTGPQRARNFKPAAVAIEDVLDDREPETGAAELPRAGGVDAVEAFGQPRQMFAGNAVAAVSDRDAHPAIGHRKPLRTARRYGDRRLRLAVFNGVVD